MRYSFVAGLVALVLLCGFSAQASTTIQEVTSPGGIKAWLVQDTKLPLIAMDFAFRGGVEQDPAAKQGLANLTMDLLTQGAGNYKAEAFQQQLADHSISLHINAGRDALSGGIKMLSSEKKTGFTLLHLALTKPRFDAGEIEQMRSRQLAGLRMQFGNVDWQARYGLFQKIFGDHPYGGRRLGTTQSLAGLTRADIQSFAAKHLAQDNLLVAVVGDMTPQELAPLLDKVFGQLPKHAVLAPITEVVLPEESEIILTPREGTQTELFFSLPGLKRDDPDWYAAEIANYILGGGGFASRLMKDVRDEKGLTYGIHTDLSPMEHAGLLIGEASTDNAKTGQAWDVILATMQRFYEGGATATEITAAKDYLTGALPLQMTSTDRIAGVLLGMQMDRLGRDDLERRNGLIRNVTEEDLQRVVRKWFNPDILTLNLVGKPEGITPMRTRALVRE